MKKLLALALALVSTMALAQNKPLTTTYTVDTSDSKVGWLAKKVTGQHNGTLKVKSGTLSFVGEQLVSGEVVVDMDSLIVEDITDSEYNAKFLGHVKSADFFDTAKYPEAKLVIKNSKKTKKGLEVKADLTFIGTTKPVKFLAVVTLDGDKATGKTKFIVDRTKWGLKYGSTSFFKGLGDKAINNDFELSVDLTAEK